MPLSSEPLSMEPSPIRLAGVVREEDWGCSSFRSREGMDRRIGVLGVSLGGYLAVALGMEDRRMPGGAFVLV
jgi:hypothetical protein